MESISNVHRSSESTPPISIGSNPCGTAMHAWRPAPRPHTATCLPRATAAPNPRVARREVAGEVAGEEGADKAR